jgi:hypothetical protein
MGWELTLYLRNKLSTASHDSYEPESVYVYLAQSQVNLNLL